jgi:hypothetical protein
MNSYELDRGSIWEVYYLSKIESSLDPNVEQTLVDKQTRELSTTFDPPKGLSPHEYSQLFMTHYTKSRQTSKEIVKKGTERLIRYKILVQVANEECLREIDQIEKLENFKEWENISLVDYFKQISKEYLNG